MKSTLHDQQDFAYGVYKEYFPPCGGRPGGCNERREEEGGGEHGEVGREEECGPLLVVVV